MRYVIILIFTLIALSSCIDEDLSKCKSRSVNVEIYYTVEPGVCDADFAVEPMLNSLHTGFWRTGDVLYEENRSASNRFPSDMLFRFTLPHDNYLHLATANADDELNYVETPFSGGTVSVSGRTLARDTIAALKSPAFAGSVNIAGDTCNCESHLYVVSMMPFVSRMNLTVTHNNGIGNLRAVIEGTKAGFSLRDTLFISNSRLRVVADNGFVTKISEEESLFSFYTFPITVVDDGYVKESDVSQYAPDGKTEWYVSFFAEFEGRTVKNRYAVNSGLYRGEVYDAEFRFYTDDEDVGVGVEVDLDWKPGGSHDEEI